VENEVELGIKKEIYKGDVLNVIQPLQSTIKTKLHTHINP